MSASIEQRDTVRVLDDLFQERLGQVPVLARRAREEGVTRIRAREDMVALLFPHTTYKSYPETLVAKGRWAQLNRWLDSLSTYRVADMDVSGVADVDGWIERLERHGHLVSSSSGTSGKSSFLNKSRRDRETSMQNMLDGLAELGLPPGPSWHVVPTGPDTGLSAHAAMREMLAKAYQRPDAIRIPAGQAVGGHHTYMARLAAMRRAMADGTASPDDVAAFEADAARRQKDTEERLGYFADEILARRGEPMFFNSMFPSMYRLTEIVKEQGAAEGDITGENALTVGGGLKGTKLPPDYREQIFRMFNITPGRFFQYYSMQELNLRMPRCVRDRYHVPPQLVLLVLDKPGEALAPETDGQVEGRAAFFDTSVDGRWGGTISGDRIRADLRGCPCGRPGPSIFDDITRYSDLPGDDKITCAGTVDAYVRGFIEE